MYIESTTTICEMSWRMAYTTLILRGLTGVAYPLSMAMREPKGWDEQKK